MIDEVSQLYRNRVERGDNRRTEVILRVLRTLTHDLFGDWRWNRTTGLRLKRRSISILRNRVKRGVKSEKRNIYVALPLSYPVIVLLVRFYCFFQTFTRIA